MAVIRLDDFGGIAPIFNERKLPFNKSALARDCRFDGADLDPYSAPVNDGVAYSYANGVGRLFKHRTTQASTWLAWPADAGEVDVVRSQVPRDSHARIYWTAGGAGSMRVASQPTQASIDTPSLNFKVGVPAPVAKPTIGSQTVPSAQPITMSQTSPVVVSTGATPHPFKDGQRVVVKVYRNGVPLNVEDNMIEINGLEFLVANSKSTTFELRDSDGENYSAFTDNSQAIIERVYADDDLVDRTYVVTAVNQWGEESAPSPPSDVRSLYFDRPVEVTAPYTHSNSYAPVTALRLYRTQTGQASSTEFYFVKELAVTPGGPLALFNDDVISEAALGELLPSADWALPPDGMTGLVALPNGFMAAFVGNALYFCEPYMPHAWPAKYRKTTPEDIVGIAVYGATLVVGTRGKPHLASGTDPGSVSMTESDLRAPCLSKRGMCAVGDGVMYPSTEGMVMVAASGPRLVTMGTHKREQWAAFWNPASDAIAFGGRYIAFSPTTDSIAIHVMGDRVDIVTLSSRGRAPAIDPDDDTLQYVTSGSGFRQRARFSAGSPLTFDWKSRVYTVEQHVTMGCAQVFADGYPVTLEVRYAVPTTPGGQPSATTTASFVVAADGPEPLRLPAGFKSREWQVRVQSNARVQAVILAGSMTELQRG